VIASPKSWTSLRSLYWSLIATTILAALMIAGTMWLLARSHAQQEWVRHTVSAREQLERVLMLVQRVETSQRGYLLTGNDAYLAPYTSGLGQFPAALDDVATLVSDNPRQHEAAGHLQQLVSEKLDELRTTVGLRQTGHSDAAIAIVNTDKGLRLMDAIRDRISSMEAEENLLLTVRQAEATLFETWLEVGTATAFLLIAGIGALVAFFTQRSFTELETARDTLLVTNGELLAQIACREQAERQFRQSQKMEAIGQLSGGIAHDFNNMLGVITAALNLMQRRIAKGDFDLGRFIDAAIQATERAGTLTHRLLAFARQQPLAPAPIDANEMVKGMTDLLRSTLGEQIRIETVCAAGLWKVNADAHQLESAILNIAINARDAMPEGGKLTIETANAYLDEAYAAQHAEIEAGQFVLIAVSDTGTGMPPEVAARAFDPFFTTKSAGKGTGLGLSQVYGFIKQSRGHIKIYSETGAGTTVKIYLPRLVGAAQDVRRAVAGPVRGGDASEIILVVEDDALMRQTSTDALRELGYTVLHSEGAVQALTILNANPNIKLLLTDVVMPDVDGRKLADEALRQRPDLRVIFTTGYTPNAVVHGGVLDPGVNFLSKPFTLEQLAAKVRAVLDQERLSV
jgi:signal transduction histidine kinase/ActR/RegA family two-component response regulator